MLLLYLQSLSKQNSASSMSSIGETASVEDVVDESVLENNQFMTNNKSPKKKKRPVSYNPFG